MNDSSGQPRETITAVVMTKNSDRWVEGALKSIVGWADEIVVIDGFSGDRTLEICKNYTDKIYQNRWDGYRFCTERNLGNSKATKDWCFHIDPDERATPAFKEAVDRVLREGTPHSAFKFKKMNFFLRHWMRYGGWYHDSLHLFRRGKARYEGIIHEALIVEGTVGRIDAAIEHYPFESLGQFIPRHNGYSTREAKAMREKEGILPAQIVEYNLKKKPLKRFLKFYVKNKGLLDGMHGLIFSVLFAWVHFINWAKYWELTQGSRSGENFNR